MNKVFEENTLFPTPEGWIRAKDIVIGTVLFDDQGQLTTVAECSSFIGEAYKVTLDGGIEIIAGADNQWRTFNNIERQAKLKRSEEYKEKRRNKRRKFRTGPRRDVNGPPKEIPKVPTARTTVEISNTLLAYAGAKVANHKNHSIDCMKPILGTHKHFEIPPYLLGALAGDGDSHRAGITSMDAEILDKIRELDFRVDLIPSQKNSGRASSYMIRPLEDVIVDRKGTGKSGYKFETITKKLKDIDFIKNKHLPVDYLRASYEQRLECLRGLMDTDGSVDVKGSCELSLSDEKLAGDAFELIQTLGIKCNLRPNRSFYKGKEYKKRWRMSFTAEIMVFSLSRKQERAEGKTISDKWKRRYIFNTELLERTNLVRFATTSLNGSVVASKQFIPA